MKGSQHLIPLALASEAVTRGAYRVDVMATYPNGEHAERNMVRLLEACDTLSSIVAEIRAAREVQS